MTETRADPSVIADAESGGRDVSRRSVVKGALAIAAGVITRPTVREDTTGRRGQSGPRVAVIGAGCFGGWTALMLQRRGARVTLVDTWGAGNSRASSGDETRVIRSIYDGNALYTDLVTRAFGLWIDEAKHWGRAVYRKTGAIWIFEGDDAFARGSVPLMRERGIPVEQLSLDEAARRFPQIRFDGARTVYVESEAGFLLARQSCELVRQSVVDAGGAYRQVRAIPGKMGASGLDGVRLANGEQLQADAYVFACGPWMGAVFPEVIGRGIIATRQDVLYFGTPPDDDDSMTTAFQCG